MSETKGTIVELKGEYFLQTSGVGAPGKTETIRVGSAADKTKFASLVGQKVDVILSEPVRSVVAIVGESKTGPFKKVRILCYKPIPDLRTAIIDEAIVNQWTKQLVNEGILSEAAGKKLTSMG